MSPFGRHRWFVAAAGITLAFASVCLLNHGPRPWLAGFANVYGLVLMVLALGVSVWNLGTHPPQERSFWGLMTLGFALWTTNQLAWVIVETVWQRPIPDPFFFDIILFFHAVPMIAAVAWRPDLANKQGKILLSVLNFFMLCGWWVFLYAFIVFPHQYVVSNVGKYNTYYDALYAVENGLLVGVLILASITSTEGWRRLYLHLLGASVVYGVNSQLLDRASANSTYYSGSAYDIALIGTISWITAAALSSRNWDLEISGFNLDQRWRKLVRQLAMLAILSLPLLGLWTVVADKSPSATRAFRLFAVLAAMLLLGSLVFFRQYLQDQALLSLLGESRRAYDSQKQLQNQLVQKEKLATLGNLVAGAAQEIDHPLSAVMSYSEQLWQKKLTDEQNALVRKIVNQARRTRDLVANLLSFAQQAPGEKIVVDLRVLLQRAMQIMEPRRQAGKVQVQLSIAPDLPSVRANANQMFQSFVEIIENAIDALGEAGGGRLEITALCHDSDVVLQFSDTGPGIRDPERVFDPFYTTKPVGKGTGLGLSAVYGVVQDHGGQITCRNKPEGGALFLLRLPILAEAAVKTAGAAS